MYLSLPGDKIPGLFQKGRRGTQWQPARSLPACGACARVRPPLWPADGRGGPATDRAAPAFTPRGRVMGPAGLVGAPAGPRAPGGGPAARAGREGAPQAAVGRGSPARLMCGGSGQGSEIPFN